MKPTRSRRASAAVAKASFEEKLVDEARFIRSWFDSPMITGAVSPSGRFLARAMAGCVDPASNGLIVELGPGTGPVTDALIARGIPQERLLLVEYDASFCKLLERRFPQTKILRGDAYDLGRTLRGRLDQPVAAIVSSLPLLMRPERERLSLLDQAFNIMGPEGVFIQFTYGLASPMPLKTSARALADYRGEAMRPVWLNIPPARVWRYRRTDNPAAPLRMLAGVSNLKFLRKFGQAAKSADQAKPADRVSQR